MFSLPHPKPRGRDSGAATEACTLGCLGTVACSERKGPSYPPSRRRSRLSESQWRARKQSECIQGHRAKDKGWCYEQVVLGSRRPSPGGHSLCEVRATKLPSRGLLQGPSRGSPREASCLNRAEHQGLLFHVKNFGRREKGHLPRTKT